MNHKEVQNLIHLYLTDDLDKNTIAKMDEHLAGCRECRSMKDETEAMISAVRQAPKVDVDDRLLNEARFQLRTALRREINSVSLAERFLEQIRLFVRPRLSMASGAAVILIAGIVTGYFLGRNSSGSEIAAVNTVGDGQNTRTDNVRIVDYNPQTNELEVAYDVVTRAHTKTRLEDNQTMTLIVKSLFQNTNSESRLRSIDMLREHYSRQGEGSSDAMDALMKTACLDESPAVRREAIIALESYSFDSRILETALKALRSDENPGVRIAAINLIALEHRPSKQYDQSFVDALKQSMQKDNNSYVRLKSKMLLQEVSQL
jgi:hypothetical protein